MIRIAVALLIALTSIQVNAAEPAIADFEGSWIGTMPKAITNKPNDLELTVTFNKKGEGDPRFVTPDGGVTFFTGAVTADLYEKDKAVRVILLREWKVALSADKKTMTWTEAKEGKTKIEFKKK